MRIGRKSLKKLSYKAKLSSNKPNIVLVFADDLGIEALNAYGGHGPKAPITISKVKGHDHPVMKDMPDGWKTPEGELYNVQEVYEDTIVLAYGDNGKTKAPKKPQACIWVNTHGKGRIFSTIIGHHNSTMSTKEYLDMLGNAVRWITEK